MGNTSTIELLSGSQFKVSTELGIDLYSVEFYQKQLLSLIKALSKPYQSLIKALSKPGINSKIIKWLSQLTNRKVKHARQN